MDRYRNETGLSNRVIAETLTGMFSDIDIDGVYALNILTDQYFGLPDAPQKAKQIARDILKEYAPDGTIQDGLDAIYKEDPSVTAQRSLGYYVEEILTIDFLYANGHADNAKAIINKKKNEKWMIRKNLVQ